MATTTLLTPIPLSDAELKLLQTLVYKECGMFFDERRIHFLRDRVHRRLKACHIESFYGYYPLLTRRESKNELIAFPHNQTVNETNYFRDKPQLQLRKQ